MDIRPKTLSIIQMVGFTRDYDTSWSMDELCEEMFARCQDFIAEMLDVVYSDGPVYFAWKPFGARTENALDVFTTFGNRIGVHKTDAAERFDAYDLVVHSREYATLAPSELDAYYAELQHTYTDTQLRDLTVYHVLYWEDDELIVDVYSAMESDEK